MARRYGEALGVHGVIVGAVTSYERRNLTPRMSDAEAVVGFVARLVDARTGEVVWTSRASGHDSPAAIMVPATEQVVLDRTVSSAVDELVEVYVDEEAESGDDTTVASDVTDTWQTWSDDGGDHGYSSEVGDEAVLVYGSAPVEDIEAYLGLLTR